MSKEYTRRKVLGTMGVSAAGVALLGLVGCETVERSQRAESAQPEGTRAAGPSVAQQGGVRVFRSRPDLRLPTVEVTTPARGTAPGYVFVAAKNGPVEEHPSQHGPMILDNDGLPVWLHPVLGEEVDAMDFKAQRYRGEPVLTWWQGVHAGWGRGEFLIFDSSYREVARVRAGNGYAGDHHEFLITDRDTALIGIYGKVPTDLTSLGGPADGVVMEGVIQEIDIETGEVIFEWHSADHVGFDESYYGVSPDIEEPFDYFHINSIHVDDENLLISARRTSAVYKIDRETGEVLWRLGGKKNDFELGDGVRFFYQHDVRRQPGGAVTIFDNRGEDMDEPSRGIALDLDEETMKATLLREYTHPEALFAIYQGNVQTLPNGNVFVGWGSAPHLSEFSRDGRLLFDARFPPDVESYRAFRFPWEGRPEEDPAIAIEPGDGDEVTVYASYNGATDVTEWEVLAGPGPEQLKAVGSVPREGFETASTVQTAEPYVGVRAKDRSGQVLGTASSPVEKA